MCVLQSRNQIPTSPSTVAALRLEHPTPVPRRRALGARGGIPGDADALSRERGTAQLPSVPPACGICPQVQAGGVRAEEASCLPRAGE